jgi:hypothetical protein
MTVVAAVEELERVKGIEPSYLAWEATALPLSYTRIPFRLTRAAKFEKRSLLRLSGRLYRAH